MSLLHRRSNRIETHIETKGYPRSFWLYLVAVALVAAGYADFPLYGIFNTAYGVFWFLGSASLGVLYDVSVVALIAFSVAAQLASIPMFFLAAREVNHLHHG